MVDGLSFLEGSHAQNPANQAKTNVGMYRSSGLDKPRGFLCAFAMLMGHIQLL